MKKILGFLFVIVFFGFGIAYFVDKSFAATVNSVFTFSACDQPLTYKIGDIDDRFHITAGELLADVKESSGKWSTIYGKELFSYDPDKGHLTINLVYDERQALTTQIGQLHEQLDNEKSLMDPQIAEFENKVADFKKRVADLNSEISYWNSRGGAPDDVFDKLYAEQQSLKAEQQNLDVMAEKLNRSTDEYNAQVGELNQTVDNFNTAIESRPEEGLYNGRDETITIYFMANRTELIHTLTHEFGHSLGIDHIKNPDAIMYYQTNNQLGITPDDARALSYACRQRTVFDLAAERAEILGENMVIFFQRMNFIPK